ncbi:MAG: YIP1 family protein [Chloroflexi bacterium]|nr:YIP1 family protein [Chloroflexota bacterium]
MIEAAQLKAAVFEEVEADRGATVQAMLVVVIVAVCTGIGALQVSGAGPIGIVYGVVGAIVAWAVWAGITYFVGTTIFKAAGTHADWGQMARVLGFAQSPGVLAILGILPAIGDIVFIVAFIWQLLAMVIAVRQALDYTSTLRALGVVIVGAVPYLLFRIFIAFVLERVA